ncbi:MAG: PRC-barrel domain-containing protein [Chloroflexia bacterium]|nr:PRC-barrel domain-containing protein [Chloroflexia bacterium]
MTTRLTKGTPVISLADGVRLGTIDRILFDPERKEIVGFSFHQGGGFFGGKNAGVSGLIDVSDVHAVGPDAVTIDDVSAVRSDLAVATRCEELIDLEELIKREVVTEGGSDIGRVTAIQFGEDSWRLTGIQVSPGIVPEGRLIAAGEVRNIGGELVVVSDEVCTPAATAAGARSTTPRVRLIAPEGAERPIAEAV